MLSGELRSRTRSIRMSHILLLACVIICLYSTSTLADHSRCSSTDCYHADPSGSSDDRWTTEEWSVGFRAKRVHPSHQMIHSTDLSEYYELVRPSHPLKSWMPIWMMVASAIFFGVLYLFSVSIHQYCSEDLISAIKMQRAEDALRADMKLEQIQHTNGNGSVNGKLNGHSLTANSASDSPSSTNGNHHRPTTARVQVVPAIDARNAPSSSPCSAYFQAYATAATSVNGITNMIEWNSRLISNIHAIISCLLGLMCFSSSSSKVDSSLLGGDRSASSSDSLEFTSSFPLFNPFSSKFTPSLLAFNEDYLRDLALMMTCGYLVYDLILCLWVRWRFRFERNINSHGNPIAVAVDDGLTLVHHILIVIAFSMGVATHIGTYFMSCFLLNEFSTPALNANFFLAIAGPEWKGGRLYKLNGVILFVVFTLSRVIFNMYVIGVMVYTWFHLSLLFLSSNWPYLCTAPAPMSLKEIIQCALLSSLAIGHVIINLFWFSSLSRAIHRKLCRKSKTH